MASALSAMVDDRNDSHVHADARRQDVGPLPNLDDNRYDDGSLPVFDLEPALGTAPSMRRAVHGNAAWSGMVRTLAPALSSVQNNRYMLFDWVVAPIICLVQLWCTQHSAHHIGKLCSQIISNYCSTQPYMLDGYLSCHCRVCRHARQTFLE